MRSFGLTPPAHSPGLPALRSANHRRLAHGLHPDDLPGASWATSPTAARALVAEEPPPDCATDRWVLKRAHGHAARGHRHVRGGHLTEADRRWIDASFAPGRAGGDGLVVEPWVARLADHTVQGWVAAEGVIRVGPVCTQDVDHRGAWRATRVAGELDPDVDRALTEAAATAGAAIRSVGYRGPFGVDGYLWRDAAGGTRLRRTSDVNARFTTGWGIGRPAGVPDLSGGVAGPGAP